MTTHYARIRPPGCAQVCDIAHLLPGKAQSGVSSNFRAALFGDPPAKPIVTTINSVLIVDDEPAVRDLMSLWVKSLGLLPTTAANAEEALATLRGARYDLAVVDVLMPGRDGLWLATEMQRDHPYTAVIIATAYTDLLGPDAPQPDIADVLVKPFQRDRFALALERGRQWRKQALKELQWHAVLTKELRERTLELCAELNASRGDPPAIEWLTAAMSDLVPLALEHGARVARYSAAVAREMALGREATDALVLAARFHDAGKAAMPEALLSKPSPLSPGERAIMRRHVEAGAEILRVRAGARADRAPRPRITRVVRRRRLSEEARGRGNSAGEPHHFGRRRVRHHDRHPPRSIIRRVCRSGVGAPPLRRHPIRSRRARRIPRGAGQTLKGSGLRA